MQEPGRNRRRIRLFSLLAAALGVGLLIAFTVSLLLPEPVQAPTPTPTQTRTPTPTPAAAEPALRTTSTLRSAASADAAIITRLGAGTEVRVLGRSPDAAWLVVGLTSASDLVGWLPVDAVEGVADVQALAVVADARSVAPTPSAPVADPDLPDLRVEDAESRRNRLTAIIWNDGPGDLVTPLFVSVDGGDPVFIDVKAGEALRVGQVMEAQVPGAYVQTPGSVSVRAFTRPEDGEADTSNNTWEGDVAPDFPNDLALERLELAGEVLTAVLRNDSVIPISGRITLTVHEAPPGDALIARVTEDIDIDEGGTAEVAFSDLEDVELTRISVTLSTEAIEDSVVANNVYPR